MVRLAVAKKAFDVRLINGMQNENLNSNCEVCFKIICKLCGWEADKNEVEAIQSGVLENCPECGWNPRVS